MKYREYLNVLRAKVESLGFPVCLCIWHVKYAGKNQSFVSLPTCLELRSNAPTPSDLDDTTYVDEEEDALDKKLPAKNQKYGKEGQKPGSKNEKIKSNDKNVQVSAVAAAAAAAASHVDVDEVEESDYGGGYSNWSSDSYEGVVAPDSPPATPPPEEVKKKNEKAFGQLTNEN